MREFGYPEFKRGQWNYFGTPKDNSYEEMPLCNTTDLYPNMLQNITVYRLDMGGVLSLESPDKRWLLCSLRENASLSGIQMAV